MHLLKDFGVILFASALVALVIFMVERSSYKRGVADAEAACSAENATLYAAQLAEIERLNAATLAAVEEDNREAARIDRALASDLSTLSTAFEELSREPSIPVLGDCRRSYDAVRLYQRAASGPASGNREVETPAGLAGLGDDPVPRPGDARGN